MAYPQIIRGTTPKIIFTFKDVEVSSINTAILAVKQNGRNVIEKPLSAANINQTSGTISWTLTQNETLSLQSTNNRAVVVCDWKTSAGVRGRSVEQMVDIGEPAKGEVI